MSHPSKLKGGSIYVVIETVCHRHPCFIRRIKHSTLNTQTSNVLLLHHLQSWSSFVIRVSFSDSNQVVNGFNLRLRNVMFNPLSHAYTLCGFFKWAASVLRLLKLKAQKLTLKNASWNKYTLPILYFLQFTAA